MPETHRSDYRFSCRARDLIERRRRRSTLDDHNCSRRRIVRCRGSNGASLVRAPAATSGSSNPGRTNSIAYRDQLWSLAWERYDQPVDHRGKLRSSPLLMRRGMILVSQGRHEEAIKEFQAGLQLAEMIRYPPLRQEVTTRLQRALGITYWNLRRYAEARDSLLKAQATQRQAGQIWVLTLDQEVERIVSLAR